MRQSSEKTTQENPDTVPLCVPKTDRDTEAVRPTERDKERGRGVGFLLPHCFSGDYAVMKRD